MHVYLTTKMAHKPGYLASNESKVSIIGFCMEKGLYEIILC